jgi:hypothetical protein
MFLCRSAGGEARRMVGLEPTPYKPKPTALPTELYIRSPIHTPTVLSLWGLANAVNRRPPKKSRRSTFRYRPLTNLP